LTSLPSQVAGDLDLGGQATSPHEGPPVADYTAPDLELALLADACLDGAECLYDPALHQGPDDPAAELPGDRAVREQIAAEVCALCPVHQACFEYAVRVRPARGVWAGLTAAQIAAAADLLGVAPVDGTQPGRARSGVAR
jgi:Transcription factor WhiB